MAQLLVRDLDPALVARLKAQATRHRRSLEAEVRVILAEAAPERTAAFHEAVRFRKQIAGVDHHDFDVRFDPCREMNRHDRFRPEAGRENHISFKLRDGPLDDLGRMRGLEHRIEFVEIELFGNCIH